mmetsp:Transcript_13006/g.39385  ORF Transcript_13006/g.39385 Transcript_13006/m.39385 type:complete len:110 (-) Transcript_13006:534-863(-)|eukprot:CAMPEP_0206138996 /NCGR_PEP_ID=MMETSP1473-20131121/4335_1 /ASSEMBLY_ACC=CAM_ASM_001109 /TAXON_ID=1461547 /ORGANISM="Stichococcus sp, Strain RCC1054" /LENGTH=109 /DNA_ID=CAMNT_0053532599 /DNA_START=192 /DNA_END=521 /DNA_ORIENTATION=+
MASASEAPPVPASSILMSASKLIAIECGAPSRAYMACKKRDANPETCLAEGDAVTGCVINLLKDLNETCPKELKAYYECMDYYSNNFLKCRDVQKAFEEVALNRKKVTK